ncbi:MAG: DNA recombination/repair protein RecA, partial [Candidatus Promineifilaceae bacterium]
MANSNGDGRMASLEKTLDMLTKKYGDGTIMRMGEAQHLQIEAIPTGSLS